MEENIVFYSDEIEMPDIKKDKLIAWINNIITSYSKEIGEINITFCNDEKLRKINRESLNHDYYTDIITFDYCVGDLVSGDIFISICRVNENAETFKTGNNEVLRVIAHGILHLLGFKDDNKYNIAEMREQEEMCIVLYNNLIK